MHNEIIFKKAIYMLHEKGTTCSFIYATEQLLDYYKNKLEMPHQLDKPSLVIEV